MNWIEQDAARVQAVGGLVAADFAALVDDFYDFYAEIERHPKARQVITGGEQQIARLKQTRIGWLQELFSGRYDRDYVERRWRVGLRHVEIGLNQVFTNAALSRLRRGLLAALENVLLLLELESRAGRPKDNRPEFLDGYPQAFFPGTEGGDRAASLGW